MEVIWSEPAEDSLDAIVSYIADDNLHAALEMDDLLRKAANGLAQFPQKGKPGRIPGTRELVPHPNYVLVYLLTKESIQIVTVLHSSQQWPPE
ncbi:MAG: type II toxin-antitoxin system RelE/ParE family toxin [Deltaproteobacteria bacterium]|jgi:addiction module RelE/StbE family toxin|nr:type II toxin-antitoxin system RelE/ParE family toxin [Deltaproteobacteria bacterium]